MNPEKKRDIEFTEFQFILPAEEGFNHPDFPEELKPKERLWETLKIVSGDEFGQRIKAEILETHHPIAKANRLFTKELSFASRRPAWTNYRERRIYFNREELKNSSFGSAFRVWAHEIGHHVAAEKAGPIENDLQRETVKKILRQAQVEIPLENSQISFWRKGFAEAYLLDGLIIGMNSSLNILDEVYANAYSFFLTTHLLAGREESTFAEVLERRLRDLNDSNPKGFSGEVLSIRLANELGWKDFLCQGATANLEGFSILAERRLGTNASQRLNEIIDAYSLILPNSQRC